MPVDRGETLSSVGREAKKAGARVSARRWSGAWG